MLRHELFAFCRHQRDALAAPGLILGLARGEQRLVACEGPGLSPRTALPLGSISKLLTAAAFADGLDRRVGDATVAQLLSHHGGLACDSGRPLAEPGRLFGYANAGYERLGPGLRGRAAPILAAAGVPARWTDAHPAASGGLVADCAGLLRLAQHLRQPELTEPRAPAGWFATAVGLGWFVDETPAGRLLRHEGRTPGATAAVVAGPGGVIAVLSPTGEGAAVWGAAAALSRFVFGAAPEDARPATPEPGGFAGEGRFEGDEALILEPRRARRGGSWLPLESCGPDAARVPSGPHAGATVEILREGGEVRWARWNGRLAARVPIG